MAYFDPLNDPKKQKQPPGPQLPGGPDPGGYTGPGMTTNAFGPPAGGAAGQGFTPAAATNGFPQATTNNDLATTNAFSMPGAFNNSGSNPAATTNSGDLAGDVPTLPGQQFNNGTGDLANYGGPYEQGGITGRNPGDLGGYGEPGGVAGPAATTNQLPLEGQPFDPRQQVGHEGSINGMNRAAYRDAWQSSGAKSMDDLNAFVQAHGGVVQSGNGTVMTPFGEQIDMLIGARGAADGRGPASAGWGGIGGENGGSQAGNQFITPGQQFNNAAPAPGMQPGATTNTGAAAGGSSDYEDLGNGMVRFPDGQVLPKDHPLFAQRTGQSAGGSGGGGTPGGGPGGSSGDFVSQNIDLPTNYTPAATAGPEAWQAQQIAAERAQGGAAVRAGQVTGPQALTAAQIAAADPYRATSEADMLADPGYAVRMKNSLAALQQSAAAKGLLRTGGTLQDLSAKAGEQASAEFGNVDARRRADYQSQLADRLAVGNSNNANNATAYGLTNQYQQGAQIANQGANLSADTFNSGQTQNLSQFNASQGNAAQQANAANSLAAWQAYQGMRQQNTQFNAGRTDTAQQQNFANRFAVQNANQGNSLAAFQANTGARLGYGNLDNQRNATANAFTLGQGQLALGNRQADQSFQLGQGQLGLGYYNADTSRQGMQGSQQLGWANYGLNADQQQFGQGYSLAQLGLQAAGAYSGAAGQYGQQSGQNATNAGAAGAAGTVGASNAWNNGLTGAANSSMDAYNAWLRSRNGAAA